MLQAQEGAASSFPVYYAAINHKCAPAKSENMALAAEMRSADAGTIGSGAAVPNLRDRHVTSRSANST